jgi:hypothetical protein
LQTPDILTKKKLNLLKTSSVFRVLKIQIAFFVEKSTFVNQKSQIKKRNAARPKSKSFMPQNFLNCLEKMLKARVSFEKFGITENNIYT